MLQSVTDTQKKLVKGWADAAAQNAGQAQVSETWRKAVDGWEDAVKNGLEAQMEWSRSVGSNLRATPNVPADMITWAEQTQELGTRWNAAQQELWHSYFGMVRKAVPVKMMGTLDDENQTLFAAWQDGVEKIVSAQSAWTQMWTERTTPKASTGTSTSTKAKRAS